MLKVLLFVALAGFAAVVGCAEVAKFLTPTTDPATGQVVENSQMYQTAEAAAAHVPAPWNEIVLASAMALQNLFLGVKKLKQVTEKNREAIAEKVAVKVKNGG